MGRYKSKKGQRSVSGSASAAVLLFLLVLVGVFLFSKSNGKEQTKDSVKDRPARFREVFVRQPTQQKVNTGGVEFSVIDEPLAKQAERYYGAKP